MFIPSVSRMWHIAANDTFRQSSGVPPSALHSSAGHYFTRKPELACPLHITMVWFLSHQVLGFSQLIMVQTF